MDPQVIQDAIRADMEQRTYYWTGEHWACKAEYNRKHFSGEPTDLHIGFFNFRGSLSAIDKLPTGGNIVGDQWIIEPESPVMALAGKGSSNDIAAFTLPAPNDTLHNVVTGVLMEPTTGFIARNFTSVLHRYVSIMLIDEKLVLVEDGCEYLLMERGAALDSCMNMVTAIEVNKLSVVATSGMNTFGIALSYDGRHIRIDSSAY